MSTVIKVDNLSKKYIIGHQRQERYTALRDVMMHKLRGVGQRLRHPLSPNKEETNLEEFWALKDINLEIKQGDRIGIIGRNGAGKSTLLKILSRITEPTTGFITINGRVASLLEVGTGFHPELTGRENIFLNGAILGMSRADIKRNFDEIVAFAEVEKFLDTPVKRYSSGMYVRLAFAIAAHLEPEILLVDEVLAVGDSSFQKKCLGKMGDVAREGRTVVFVSHNMAAVKSLCPRSILTHHGKIIRDGPVDDVINSYMSTFCAPRDTSLDNRIDRIGDGYFRFTSIDFVDTDNNTLDHVTTGQKIFIKIGYTIKSSTDLNTIRFSIGFKNMLDQLLFSCPSIVQNFPSGSQLKGKGFITCEIPKFPLPSGSYSVNLFSSRFAEVTDWIDGVGVLEVKPGDFFGTGKLPTHGGKGVFVDFTWKIE